MQTTVLIVHTLIAIGIIVLVLLQRGKGAEAGAHVENMTRQDADIIDVGGESTRPGAAPVSVQAEIDRVAVQVDLLGGGLNTRHHDGQSPDAHQGVHVTFGHIVDKLSHHFLVAEHAVVFFSCASKNPDAPHRH